MAIPTDPYLGLQWHLRNDAPGMLDLNVTKVWANSDPLDLTSPTYSGSGTRTVIVADGFDYNHADLSPNYNRNLDYDFEFESADALGSTSEGVGTAMAGILGAAANGVGTVGVAYGTELVGYRIRTSYDNDWLGYIPTAIQRALSNAQADVIVFANYLRINYETFSTNPIDLQEIISIRNQIASATSSGRNGLGIAIVKAAGDFYEDPEWYEPAPGVNLDPWTNDTRQIVVGGVDEYSQSTNSTMPGSPILISGFSAIDEGYYTHTGNIFSTDRRGLSGFANRDYVYDFGETKAAAAMVGGVVSLMYEANTGLGWRDVQAILAASARHVGNEIEANFSDWQWNGAENWNGGAMHFSNGYGYGLVDAWAAVRLAETWQLTNSTAQTTANQSSLTLDVLNSTIYFSQNGNSEYVFSRNTTSNFIVERASVQITMDVDLLEFSIYLISPSGEESELNSHSSWSRYNGTLNFETQALRGEQSAGLWSVRVVDDNGLSSEPSFVSDVIIRVYGASSFNDRYVYTDEYSQYVDQNNHPSYINDDNGGIDTINVSAVSSGSIVRLKNSSSTIDGVSAYFTSTIENVIGGDFGDNITGSDGANQLYGRRGADSINGSAGNDGVYGAWGDDILNGGSGVDTVAGGSENDTVFDDDLLNGDQLLGEAGIDTIDYSRVSFAAGLVTLNLATGLATTTASSARDTISGFENAFGSQGGETIRGTSGGNILTGNGGDDRLIGEAGNDVLTGGLGKDSLYGGAGADRFVFTSRAESPLGTACDALVGYTSGPAFDGAGAAAGDIIDLANIDANETTAGNQAFTFSTAQTIGTLRCFESSGLTWVLGYTNSTAGADFQIEIQDGTVLASTYRAADFVL